MMPPNARTVNKVARAFQLGEEQSLSETPDMLSIVSVCEGRIHHFEIAVDFVRPRSYSSRLTNLSYLPRSFYRGPYFLYERITAPSLSAGGRERVRVKSIYVCLFRLGSLGASIVTVT